MDLEKLKAEINSRNTNRNNKQVSLGNIPDGAIPKQGKRQFLNELVTSMHTGRKTDASEAIRVVNETVENKKGSPNAVAKNAGKYVPPRSTRQQLVEQEVQQPQQYKSAADEWGLPTGVAGNRSGGHDGERDDLFESQNARFDQMMMGGNPVASKIMKQPTTMTPSNQQRYITEQKVNESDIDQLLTEKLERNMEKMVESTFKSVLTNIYTKQKIQEALGDFLESDDFVKVVGKAINEIAKRNKAKQGK